MSDPKKLAGKKVTILENWLENAKSVQDTIPKVQRELDIAKWELATIATAPEGFAKDNLFELTKFYNQDLQMIRQSLPKITISSSHSFDVSSGSTASTSSHVYFIAVEARKSLNPDMEGWGILSSNQYELLQNQIGRESEVRSLLYSLKEELATEFDHATASFQKSLTGAVDQTAAGIAIRNVHEHYKGQLMNLARRHPKENNPSWATMADRLIDNQGPNLERFLKEEKTWKDLQQKLSRITKALEEVDQSEFKSIFTRFIDHLYIVLKLITSKDNQ